MTTDAKLTAWCVGNAPDCGDNSCLFGGRGRGGMRTNGGCRCFKDLPLAKRVFVERVYAALHSLAAEPVPQMFKLTPEMREAFHISYDKEDASLDWALRDMLAAAPNAAPSIRQINDMLYPDGRPDDEPVAAPSDTPRTDALIKSDRPFAGSELAEQAFDKMSYLARTLERELAEAKQDAARYRWLCDGNGNFMEEWGLCAHDQDKARADREIDVARKLWTT